MSLLESHLFGETEAQPCPHQDHPQSGQHRELTTKPGERPHAYSRQNKFSLNSHSPSNSL